MKMTVFWDIAQCSLVEVYRHFKGACCLHHQGMIMEAAGTSEMLVNFYWITWCNIPEGTHLHTDLCKNLKCHELQEMFSKSES
jgi:hypothetical protein